MSFGNEHVALDVVDTKEVRTGLLEGCGGLCLLGSLEIVVRILGLHLVLLRIRRRGKRLVVIVVHLELRIRENLWQHRG